MNLVRFHLVQHSGHGAEFVGELATDAIHLPAFIDMNVASFAPWALEQGQQDECKSMTGRLVNGKAMTNPSL